MKNKKGFTLIEVIVSLVIIISISTLVIVNLKKESVDDVRKLENKIISSSDVYFSLNNSKIKELEDNYGYLVLTVQELLDMGIVDENFLKNKLTSELLGSEVDNYKKLVIKKIDNNLNEDGLLGLYDIIYPYTINSNISLIFDNYLYYGNITGINICKLGLTDNIKYFNMNYEVSNLSVSDYEKEEPNNLWCEMIPETNNLYEYSFCNSNTSCEDSNIIYGYRKIDVCNLREIKVYDGDEEFNTDSWVNNSSEIKVKINGDSSDSCGNYFKLKDNINNNLADEFTLTFTENGENIEKKYSIVERDETINFTEKEVEFPSESFIFKVDLNGPNIGNYESHGNNYKVTIKDEVSKLDYYKIGDEPENHRCNNNSECIIELTEDDENKVLKVCDIASNCVQEEISYSGLPRVIIDSQSGVWDEFKFPLKVKNLDAETIKVRWKYREESYLEKEYTPDSYSSDGNNYVVNLADFLNLCIDKSTCVEIINFNDITLMNLEVYGEKDGVFIKIRDLSTNLNIKVVKNSDLKEDTRYSDDEDYVSFKGWLENGKMLIETLNQDGNRVRKDWNYKYYLYNPTNDTFDKEIDLLEEVYSTDYSTGSSYKYMGNDTRFRGYCTCDEYRDTDISYSYKMIINFTNNLFNIEKLGYTSVKCQKYSGLYSYYNVHELHKYTFDYYVPEETYEKRVYRKADSKYTYFYNRNGDKIKQENVGAAATDDYYHNSESNLEKYEIIPKIFNLDFAKYFGVYKEKYKEGNKSYQYFYFNDSSKKPNYEYVLDDNSKVAFAFGYTAKKLGYYYFVKYKNVSFNN